MAAGSYAVEGAFAIVAGVMTIAKGKAWIGTNLPPTFVLHGRVAFLIGVLAIVLGLFLLVVR